MEKVRERETKTSDNEWIAGIKIEEIMDENFARFGAIYTEEIGMPSFLSNGSQKITVQLDLIFSNYGRKACRMGFFSLILELEHLQLLLWSWNTETVGDRQYSLTGE